MLALKARGTGRVGYSDFGVCGEDFEFFEELYNWFRRVDEIAVDDLSIGEEFGMIESILMQNFHLFDNLTHEPSRPRQQSSTVDFPDSPDPTELAFGEEKHPPISLSSRQNRQTDRVVSIVTFL
jgi:hypothetical protein